MIHIYIYWYILAHFFVIDRHRWSYIPASGTIIGRSPRPPSHGTFQWAAAAGPYPASTRYPYPPRREKKTPQTGPISRLQQRNDVEMINSTQFFLEIGGLQTPKFQRCRKKTGKIPTQKPVQCLSVHLALQHSFGFGQLLLEQQHCPGPVKLGMDRISKPLKWLKWTTNIGW